MILINDLTSIQHLNLPKVLIDHLVVRFKQSFPDGHTLADGYFAVIEPTDTLTAVCSVVGVNLEYHTPEFMDAYDGFYEVVFVTGDSGIGADLFIMNDLEQVSEWITYCQGQHNEHFLPAV